MPGLKTGIGEKINIFHRSQLHPPITGNGYNIPVTLWLDESFPRTAPICFVKPTGEMMILPGEHVNSNGEILLPYLTEWRHVSSLSK